MYVQISRKSLKAVRVTSNLFIVHCRAPPPQFREDLRPVEYRAGLDIPFSFGQRRVQFPRFEIAKQLLWFKIANRGSDGQISQN
jgi:hypothetical protein